MKSSPPSPVALFKQFSGARFWPVWIMFGLLRVLSWLPLPVTCLLGSIGGEIAYWLHRPRRKITWRNLTVCFPEKKNADIRALARGHFRVLAVAALASGVGWWSSATRLARLTRFQNRAVYEQARKRGENIILLTPHFVGLECGGMFLSTLAPTACIYQRNKNPLIAALTKQRRARFDSIQYASKRGSKTIIRPIIKLIRQGFQFYYLPDQDPGHRKSVFAPFYSVPVATFAALGRIARLSNATVIPCATRLLPYGRGFEIIFEQQLTNFPCGHDLADATQMNQAIEALIARAPEQYLWSHRRFKTRPQGEPPFYE